VGLRDRRRNVRCRRRRSDVWRRGRCRVNGRRPSALIPSLLRGGIGRERRQNQHQRCRGAKTCLSHRGDSWNIHPSSIDNAPATAWLLS
jgi:hypothetical protein